MLLESTVVTDTFLKCMYTDTELTAAKQPIPEGAIIVEGITIKAGFHPGRIEENKASIIEMLMELPEPFHHDKGGGYTFLAMCEDKNGRQWTGLHKVMQELVLLGKAIGYVHECIPRDMWDALPGGVPYYVIGPKGPLPTEVKVDTPPEVTDEEYEDGIRKMYH